MTSRRYRPLVSCLLIWACLGCAWPAPAQEPPDLGQFDVDGLVPPPRAPRDEPEEEAEVILPEEPMSPREELFLAIELKDVEAARRALENGADVEVSSGDPSPLATAALHNDLRMVVLLLDAGGDPAATADSPLEEAVRNENTRMVELFMSTGARVPAGQAGQELFRLAQRGDAATELSRILLDHGADSGQCLAAATGQARIELMKYCLGRGADPAALPPAMNGLGVAIAGGDPELVDLILAADSEDRMLIGAFTEAVTAGRQDLVQRALAAGAVPVFAQVEAAIESGGPEISLLLLDQGDPDDPSMLSGGDVEALIQRAEDLDYPQVAAALRDRSGISSWPVETWLPLVLGALVVVLGVFVVLGLLRRRPASAAAVPATGVPAAGVPAAGVPAESSGPRPGGQVRGSGAETPAGARPATAGGPDPGAPLPEGLPAPAAPPGGPAAVPAAGALPSAPPAVTPAADVSPAATLPIGAIPMPPTSMPAAPAPAAPAPAAPAPAVPAPAVPEAAASASPAPSPSMPAAPVPTTPAPAVPAPAAAAASSDVWQVAPEPVTEPPPAAGPPDRVAGAAAPRPQPAVELRMPEVDLSRAADEVFEAARKTAASASAGAGASDRRQVALVTPARVTMLRSCPAPGSLSPEQLAVAERLAGASPSRNVAAIAFTDLDAIGGRITEAIPFFDLLRQLGYLGHAVWIFEGHVSAMAAGCRDADVLIVDDGMMPYLPGNWRSVATRAMRGSDIHLFERKTGSLRRLT